MLRCKGLYPEIDVHCRQWLSLVDVAHLTRPAVMGTRESERAGFGWLVKGANVAER